MRYIILAFIIIALAQTMAYEDALIDEAIQAELIGDFTDTGVGCIDCLESDDNFYLTIKEGD